MATITPRCVHAHAPPPLGGNGIGYLASLMGFLVVFRFVQIYNRVLDARAQIEENLPAPYPSPPLPPAQIEKNLPSPLQSHVMC